MTSSGVEAVIEAGRQQVRAEAEALADIVDQIDERFVRVASLIKNSTGKVILTGSGTSGFIGRRSAHIFSVSGTPAFFLDPGAALHGSLGVVEADDIVIALSRGGTSAEVNDVASRVTSIGTPVVALTANAQSPLGRISDLVIELRHFTPADPGAMLAMGSTLAYSAWLDALALVLMRSRQLSWERVQFTHPGGAAGLVEDLPQGLEALEIPDQVPPA